MVFGDDVQFIGAWHGVLPFILVIVAMIVAEALARFIFVKLGDSPARSTSEA